MIPELSALPGGELVMRGLEDLCAGDSESVEALLVQIARPRLLAAGIAVPGLPRENVELALYARLVKETEDPYAAYNSLLRRLVSCAAALEHGLYRQECSSS